MAVVAVLLTVFFSVFPAISFSQDTIVWKQPFKEVAADGSFRLWLDCEQCYQEEVNGLPVYRTSLPTALAVESSYISAAKFRLLAADELAALNVAVGSLTPGMPEVRFQNYTYNGEIFTRFEFVPLRITAEGNVEKIVSYTLGIQFSDGSDAKSAEIQDDVSTSVLSAGDWYRIAVSSTGVHQLSYSDLAAMGVPVAGLATEKIRIHGYGGGMLPERSGLPRYDDLPEIAVKAEDGGDGIMNEGDYLLFYARGPVKWSYNATTGLFEHQPHLYTDQTYYYITTGDQPGKRIQEFPQPQSDATAVITAYHWFDAYQPNEVNLIKSGKEWYGDVFDLITERTYKFTDFTPEASAPLTIKFSAVARSLQTSSFTLKAAGEQFNLFISPITTDFNTNYARISTETFNVNQPDVNAGFSLKYNKSLSSSTGWLNYLELNALSKLQFSNGQKSFRRAGLQGIVEYRISSPVNQVLIWDVTDPLNPGKLNYSASGNTLIFKALADTLREYILSDFNSYLKPVFVEKVSNQNLHSLSSYSMVIVSHPDFYEEATRLATFHAQHNNLSVLVVTPQQIYNEFSSGSQDISAIRDFMKMLYKRNSGSAGLRFLLLFGDASYDPKNRLAKNSAFIPSYYSPESLHPVTSYVSDDFFGSLDDNEGGLSSDVPDIGIGRLPVQTADEAKMAVDKIIHYATSTDKVNGDWRNVITFVADDGDNGDGNVHMQQADMLARMIDTTYRSYNLDKIYFDAYPQISTPGGQRIPDASLAINQRMDKGALIVNYTGHGGEVGWAHERVLEVADIRSWTNYNRMPVFMTATCEFSRFDDPGLTSAGELVFLNPDGGGIALFTTSRPTFGTPNFTLSQNFYNIAFDRVGDEMPYLGDIIRLSKLATGGDNNSKKFVLLGDPAMKMAYPRYNVVTENVNGRAATVSADTLKALSEITISGIIADESGNRITGFNGEITPTVFDKVVQVTTFATAGSSPFTFGVRRNIIYKGKVNVTDGAFSFTFIVPRDIAYQYGQGKISYYATDGNEDAAGYFEEIVVGGFSDRDLNDLNGPEIALFMNDRKFKDGGFTGENPVLIADLRDVSGINTIGSGIGHDIVAILDDETGNPYILNDFYESDLNTYMSGVVSFPFHGLEPGPHTVRLKVWDVNNNSSEVSISFIVASTDGITLGNFEAWPNPMRDQVTFAIEHNQAGKEMNLTLDIFSLSGSRVASLNESIFAEGYRTTGFDWDGRGSDGRRLADGFYIGRIRLKTSDGLVADKSVKIVIAR
jgi:hypothetical protein